jgi:hypothetical protein
VRVSSRGLRSAAQRARTDDEQLLKGFASTSAVRRVS